MSERLFVNLLTGVLVLTLLVILLWLTGCTTYDIIRHEDGTTSVHVKSWRSFQDVALVYNRDGDVVGFKFGAASVVSQTPIDAALKGIEMGISIATGRPASTNETE